MATRHYENGIVGTSESGSTDVSADIFTTGEVYYVNSVGGNDSNAGTNRNLPKATIAGAISAATANNGDVVIVESGHAEISASSIAFSKAGIRFYGLGAGTNKPSFTVNGNVDLFNITGARVALYNMRFPAGSAAHTARVNVNAASCWLRDLDFTCGVNDLESITLPDAGDDVRIEGCSWTITADGPDSGIKVESATLLGLKVIECQFDGGLFDFDDAGLFSAVAHTEFFYKDNTLINKASIIHTAAAKGICTGTIAGDGSRVQV